ncbi:MAG: hypothetical protein JWM43_2216 [Acidobacteriaceae bacterium]|nr:hypothetical protein [Acidobacteriaceae bacterium]
MPCIQLRNTLFIGLLALPTVAFTAAAAPTPRHTTLTTLSSNARELFTDSIRTADASFDPTVHLLRKPRDPHGNAVGTYMVRESSWFALGLLLRDAVGDRAQAATILDTVLAQQYTDPTKKWFGSFKRSPEEPTPTPTNQTHYEAYDPNWRVFIGTTFEMILIEFPDRIPAPLATRLYQAIDNAIAGEANEHRLTPAYSNIALMYGALWDFTANHSHDVAQRTQSAQWNESVYTLFKTHNTFNEYNSPTYYGVDLYGLALLRDYASTSRLRSIASEMESTLWSDIADFYSPDLRNISGPYDRSYGMDMQSYVTVTGVWIRTLLPAAQAPLPITLDLQSQHLGDLWFASQFVILGTRIPPVALNKLKHPAAPHLVRRTIDAKRTATAWIGSNVIYGGESNPIPDTSGATNKTSQFHPATLQWKTPTGAIGWVRLLHISPIDASADPQGLTIRTSRNELEFLIHLPGLDAAAARKAITQARWSLPGLPTPVETDAKSFQIKSVGLPEDQTYSVIYTSVTQLHLAIPPRP